MMEIISDWTESTERPGYRVRVMKNEYCTVEVYRPILSEEERKKREEHIALALGGLMSAYYKRKVMEEYEQQNHN